jgi:hypothetical protein
MWDRFDSILPPRRDVVECIIIGFGVVFIVLALLKKNPTITIELINLKLSKDLLLIKEKEEIFQNTLMSMIRIRSGANENAF